MILPLCVFLIIPLRGRSRKEKKVPHGFLGNTISASVCRKRGAAFDGESGAKPLGESTSDSPRPRAILVTWSGGCDPGRLGLQRIA